MFFVCTLYITSRTKTIVTEKKKRKKEHNKGTRGIKRLRLKRFNVSGSTKNPRVALDL